MARLRKKERERSFDLSPAVTSANRNKREKLREGRNLTCFLSNIGATQHFRCCFTLPSKQLSQQIRDGPSLLHGSSPGLLSAANVQTESHFSMNN